MKNNWDPGSNMNTEVKDDYLYSKTHEWAKKNEDGNWVIGLTPFAIDQLGDITMVDIHVTDIDMIEAGSEIGTIESVKTLSDIYTPVTGAVVAVNKTLLDQPELLNESPWDDGWLLILEPEKDDEYATRDCISPEEYSKQIGK